MTPGARRHHPLPAMAQRHHSAHALALGLEAGAQGRAQGGPVHGPAGVQRPEAQETAQDGAGATFSPLEVRSTHPGRGRVSGHARGLPGHAWRRGLGAGGGAALASACTLGAPHNADYRERRRPPTPRREGAGASAPTHPPRLRHPRRGEGGRAGSHFQTAEISPLLCIGVCG